MKITLLILLSIFLTGLNSEEILKVKKGDILIYQNDWCSNFDYDGCKLRVEGVAMFDWFEEPVICGKTFDCNNKKDEKDYVCFNPKPFSKMD